MSIKPSILYSSHNTVLFYCVKIKIYYYLYFTLTENPKLIVIMIMIIYIEFNFYSEKISRSFLHELTMSIKPVNSQYNASYCVKTRIYYHHLSFTLIENPKLIVIMIMIIVIEFNSYSEKNSCSFLYEFHNEY